MKQQIIEAALCLLIVLGALGVIAWALVTGQIGKQGIDALFLIAVCLVTVLLFAPFPVQAIRQGAIAELWKRKKKPEATEAKSAATPPVAPVESQETQEKRG